MEQVSEPIKKDLKLGSVNFLCFSLFFLLPIEKFGVIFNIRFSKTQKRMKELSTITIIFFFVMSQNV
jgi:hypothetical protein